MRQQAQHQTQNIQAKVASAKQIVNGAQTKVGQIQSKLKQDQQKQQADQQAAMQNSAVQQAQTKVNTAQQTLNDTNQAVQNAQNKLHADQQNSSTSNQFGQPGQLGTPWLSNNPRNNGEQNGSKWAPGFVGIATKAQEAEWDNGVHVDANAQAILDQLNLQRIAHGVAPVKLDANLEKTAQWRVSPENSDSLMKNFHHTNEGSNTAFAHGYMSSGENIAEGYAPDQCVNGWNSEPTHAFDHRMNDFNPGFTNVGVAFYHGYAVIDFAGTDFGGMDYKGLDDDQIWTGEHSVTPVSMIPSNNNDQQIKADQDALNAAITCRNNAQNALTAAQNNLKAAINNSEHSKLLQQDADAIANDQVELKDAEQKLTTAQAVLKQAENNSTANSDAVMNAQKQYQAALDTLNNQKAQLINLQNQDVEYQKDQLALKNAQAKFTQAQDDYNNAVKALNDAQKQENSDREMLEQTQKNYAGALDKLNKLEAELKNEEKNITTTAVQWITDQHPATTAEMGNLVALRSSSQSKIIKNTQSAVSIEKEVNAAYADTVSAVKLAQTGVIHFTGKVPASSKKAAKKNVLPQMGDENLNKTIWGEVSLAMAGVLATLGLVDRKRRN